MQPEPNKTLAWTKEERDRVVAVFELLINMDKKQHPDNYKKSSRAK